MAELELTPLMGKTTTTSFYGKDDVVTDCSGQVVAQQSGVKSVTVPGGQVVTQVNVPGADAIQTADGASTECGTALDGNGAFATTTDGLGPTVRETTIPMVGGDPLKQATSTTAGGETTTETTSIDTNGQAWKTVDDHGDRKSTRLNSSHTDISRMPSSA